MYLLTSPWWLRMLYPSLVWRMPGREKVIYLTFDDGPHGKATPFVLDLLAQYGAKAVFFCIGKNVAARPDIYARIQSDGHSVGNHTYHHLNGWRTDDNVYLEDIRKTAALVTTPLFRPPYGRIRRSQLRKIASSELSLKTVMWSVLSGDFDTRITGEACLQNVLRNTRAGSVIVFHDSEKAWERLSYALPRMLAHFSAQGYTFRAINP
ncbi:polysaccharide deacetylase family protein [Sediminibacterium soli]|uniref:polysaccharide deacetylase family protein n=1 Tax=Sediminibacterium soli TaxID=2698829 RepID=UPI00137A1F35|nr:polysaccharide deacetylase family protein [Sediminibacterium soli]NCI45597.1 polysaccharide deacetylase family protein [Sediminibacterium soli]